MLKKAPSLNRFSSLGRPSQGLGLTSSRPSTCVIKCRYRCATSSEHAKCIRRCVKKCKRAGETGRIYTGEYKAYLERSKKCYKKRRECYKVCRADSLEDYKKSRECRSRCWQESRECRWAARKINVPLMRKCWNGRKKGYQTCRKMNNTERRECRRTVRQEYQDCSKKAGVGKIKSPRSYYSSRLWDGGLPFSGRSRWSLLRSKFSTCRKKKDACYVRCGKDQSANWLNCRKRCRDKNMECRWAVQKYDVGKMKSCWELRKSSLDYCQKQEKSRRYSCRRGAMRLYWACNRKARGRGSLGTASPGLTCLTECRTKFTKGEKRRGCLRKCFKTHLKSKRSSSRFGRRSLGYAARSKCYTKLRQCSKACREMGWRKGRNCRKKCRKQQQLCLWRATGLDIAKMEECTNVQELAIAACRKLKWQERRKCYNVVWKDHYSCRQQARKKKPSK